MDFSFTEEQQEVRDLARKILEDLSTHERLREVEAGDEGVDLPLWRELARANLLGVGLPEAHGGSDFGYLALCVLLQEIGRAVAAVPALPTLVLGALPIARFGSEAQRERWLPGAIAGDVLLSGALQEAGATDPTRPATRARPDGDAWRLDGVKICVPAAHLAQRVLVPARAAEGAAGLLLVDPAAEGVELVRQATTNREPQFQLGLVDVRVPPEDVLVAPGADAAALPWLLERATIALCALQLGVSESALERTAAYTIERHQFGRPIASFQAVHERAADAFIQVEAMRLTLWQAATRLEAERPAAREVMVAKYWACEGGHSTGYAAQHLHGGIGIDVDYPLHRYYLWARQLELTLGSAPVQLARLGADLAREPVRAAS